MSDSETNLKNKGTGYRSCAMFGQEWEALLWQDRGEFCFFWPLGFGRIGKMFSRFFALSMQQSLSWSQDLIFFPVRAPTFIQKSCQGSMSNFLCRSSPVSVLSSCLQLGIGSFQFQGCDLWLSNHLIFRTIGFEAARREEFPKICQRGPLDLCFIYWEQVALRL
jgi:hypothetical protein